MDIGIGLPATIPGVKPDQILDFARKADAGPFTTLTMIDRLVFDNYEPLVMLSAVAVATTKVKLMPSVLLAPLRNTAWLAKQTATLDAISGGRLVLGLGVGARGDDFTAAEADLGGRGKHFEEQIHLMKRIWSGQPFSDEVGPIGPPPGRTGGPLLMIGGYHPNAINRVRWADGYVTGGRPVSELRQFYDMAEAAWRDEGRPGRPQFQSGIPFALGERALEGTIAFGQKYYAFMGPNVAKRTAAILKTPEEIRDAIKAFQDIGTDELTFSPGVPDLDQVERLADIVG
jgi:alkanesulfonate monooxygenase SsuD/methylene tetrahydromethanopterin reductase-like flavin-dependent oxidoreductase (luciferase family)